MIGNLEVITQDKNIFGGKAVTLAKLLKSGFAVPKGFALSKEIFSEIMDFNNFCYKEHDYLKKSNEIRNFIAACKIPAKVEDLIQKHLDEMLQENAHAKFAVRSSAICEDLEFSSMAGIFESYVGLDNVNEVKAAILKCYQSLFNDRALAYICENGIGLDNMKMGIIIQEFIEGTMSGVTFTADTIDMNENFMDINVVNGICSKFVAGETISSLYKIDKNNGCVLECNIPDSMKKIQDTEIGNLFNTFLQIEQVLKYYQDIEWTVSNGKIYILQARPITTFKNKNFPVDTEKLGCSEYTWFLWEESPFKPLEEEVTILSRHYFNKGAAEAGHGYCDEFTVQNGYIYTRSKDLALEDKLDTEEQRRRLGAKLDLFYDNGEIAFQDIYLPEFLKLINKMRTYIGRKISSHEACDFIESALEYIKKTMEYHWTIVESGNYINIFQEYCKKEFGEIDLDDFCSLIYNVSILTKERLYLSQMAKTINDNAELKNLFFSSYSTDLIYARLSDVAGGKELIGQLNVYAEDFAAVGIGSRCLDKVVLEKPQAVLPRIREFLFMDADALSNTINETMKNKENVKERLLGKIDDSKKSGFLRMLNMAEKAFLVNDNHNFYIDLSSSGYLRLAIEASSKILADEGTIENAEDIYFLKLDEIKNMLLDKTDYKAQIEARKQLYKEQRRMLAPWFLGREPGEFPYGHGVPGETPDSDKIGEGLTLSGNSGLRKKVTGKVHVGMPEYLEEDRILVLPHGHCGDLLEILSRVKGIIFEEGSPFDHMGIIAREMGIPVLYGVTGVFGLIQNDDQIELDGINNKVTLISR